MTTGLARNDSALITAFLGGDQEAFATLHRRHLPTVIEAARRIVIDPAIAEEVAQEVLLDLWRRPWRHDPDRGSLASLLTVQARSRAIDRVRSETSRREREERDHHDPVRPTRHEFDVADREAIQGAIAAHDLDQRTAIELAFYQGYSYREVATIIGQAEGTVKSRIRRGLSLLRASLQDLDPGLLGAI